MRSNDKHYQDPPTGCLETLTGGFWAPVVTRKHLLEGAGTDFFLKAPLAGILNALRPLKSGGLKGPKQRRAEAKRARKRATRRDGRGGPVPWLGGK